MTRRTAKIIKRRKPSRHGGSASEKKQLSEGEEAAKNGRHQRAINAKEKRNIMKNKWRIKAAA